ncbi:MAG: glutamate--cysteine ligase [Alphaproteobacteria bacterium]
MTAAIFQDQTPVRSKDLLVEQFEKSCKPEQKIGLEDEKFIYTEANFQRLGYEASPGDFSIPTLLKEMAHNQPGWEPVLEENNWIGLSGKQTLGMISLEPGGQLEFASHPWTSLHELWENYQSYLRLLSQVTQQQGLLVLNSGVDPLTPLSAAPQVPKQRYNVMRSYMPQQGTLGLWMMHQTCTTQLSFDFATERDMVQKMRLGLLLQPLVTALFANSPFCEGKLNGYESYRAHIWAQTDPHRCGTLPFVFEAGMGFERYVDYALDVPMYFLYREGVYHPVQESLTFRQFMENPKKAPLPTEPLLSDWQLHLTTLFPDVRLKNVIEMRGADSCSPEDAMALAAFWVGLLYHAPTAKAVETLLKSWNIEALLDLAGQVPRLGMGSSLRGKTLFQWAEQLLPLIYQGLVGRNLGEEVFFAPLEQLLEAKTSPAGLQRLIFQETGNLEPVLAYLAS